MFKIIAAVILLVIIIVAASAIRKDWQKFSSGQGGLLSHLYVKLKKAVEFIV